MADGDFVSYLRVSTDRQGKSGLGLEAQRAAVAGYLNGGKWRVVREFVEVESGRNSARPVLEQALAEAELRRVPLVVAKVDRLTRSLAFLTRLIEAGVDVRFCDLPKIEGPAGRFMLQQMAAVAELEAGMIAKRTKDALAAAKARGVRLGGRRANQPGLTPDVMARGRHAQATRADERARKIAPIIAELRAAGVTSLRKIAEALAERGIGAPRGGEWSAAQVRQLLARIDGECASVAA
jgi:DNA invertase Pin-like site-specific DNA recombinase